MVSIIILIGSILLFSGISHLLGKEFVSRRHYFGYSTGYSRTALRFERRYKIFAFLILGGMLLWGAGMSLVSLIMSDPF